jgi:hypothetical protein
MTSIFRISFRHFTALTGHIFFLVLFLFALVYYRERMLYYDPAFFSFQMIDSNNFSIAINRWGSALAELLPLWALYNQATLETFLQLFSVSFILLYYIFFLIIHYAFRETLLSWVLMLTLCLTFRLTFYYSTAELYQGLALTVVFWALLKNILSNPTHALLKMISACLLIVFISFYHQLTAFTVFFVITFEMLLTRDGKNKKLLTLILFTIIWYLIRIKVLTFSAYENEKMISPTDFLDQIKNIRHLFSTIYIKQFIKDNFFIPLTAFAAATIIMSKKNIPAAVFPAIYMSGFIILVCVTLYKGETNVMLENYISVVGLFLAATLVYASDIKKYPLWVASLCILLAFSLSRIYDAKKPLTIRNSQLKNAIQYGRSFVERKFIVSDANYHENHFWYSWALPFETALLSSIDGPSHAVTFFRVFGTVPDTIEKHLKEDNLFLGPDFSPFWFTTNNMNQDYISLPPSQYLNLSTRQDSITFNEASFSNKNFTITPVKKYFNAEPDIPSYVEVVLLNTNEEMLPSVPGNFSEVSLWWKLYSSGDKPVLIKEGPCKLDFDLYPWKKFTQLVPINPLPEGEYTIAFDMMTRGKRKWNIDSNCILEIR